MKKIVLAIIIVVVLIGGFFILRTRTTNNSVSENEELVTENESVRIYYPLENQAIVSPLEIRGEARGSWFFEGDFPIILTNWDGLIIAEGYATAQEDWMTEEFVSFTSELTFEKPEYKDNGAIIFKKDNPSGLPEHDDAFEYNIFFK